MLRSKNERVFDGVAILLPIILIGISSLLIVLSIQGILAGTKGVFVDKLSMFILLIISTTTIATSTVPHIIRRDIDKGFAANLKVELKSIKEQLCKPINVCDKRIPLHHNFFDNHVGSGMLSHINPDCLYDVERVYWLVNEYNEYSMQLTKGSNILSYRVIEQYMEQAKGQIEGCIVCLCKKL